MVPSLLRLCAFCLCLLPLCLLGQETDCTLLTPRYLFDGEQLLDGQSVLVLGDTIAEVGPAPAAPPGCSVLAYPEGTLLPGLIEGHAHLLLHPYNETSWNDQVLLESYAERATLAGVSTIEHGDGGTPEVFALMAERGVALCPTLAAGDAILQYRGWNKGVDPEPERIVQKRASFTQALAAGVTIVAGGDVGVFPHGDNVRELEMMVDYGMTSLAVLQSVTAGNARVFGLGDRVGSIQRGHLADLLVVNGDPTKDISRLRDVQLVLLSGKRVAGQ